MSKFLVVDDDPATVTALASLLRDDGHVVEHCTAANAAIEALTRETFDVVLTDHEMPSVDGAVVVRANRRSAPDACVVVVSARAEESYRQLHEAGACIVADKPFDYDGAMTLITECRARRAVGESCPRRVADVGDGVVRL